MTQSVIQWFIARDGQQHGPISDTEMKKLVELSHLRPGDLVWRQGFPDWRPALTVFPPPAPPPSALPVQSAPIPPPGPPPPAGPPAQTAAVQPHRQPVPGAVPGIVPGLNPGIAPGLGSGAGRPAQHGRPAAIDTKGDPRRGQPQPQQQWSDPTGADPTSDYTDEPRGDGGRKKRLLTAAAVILVLVGVGGFAVVKLRGSPVTDAGQAARMSNAGQTGSEALTTSATRDQVAAAPAVAAPIKPVEIANAELDSRLQKIPAWKIIRRDFPQWYADRIKEADALVAAGKPDGEVDKFMVGEIMKLRRQNAKDALAAPSQNLKSVAQAFLDNLAALEAYGIPACHAFIFRGEITGVVVEMMHSADQGKQINAQIVSIFEAINAGRRTPTKHETPQRKDYDVLAGELSKIGWNQSDIQLFADPRALGQAPPGRVCTMVQDWFKAHLAVADAGVQERLLFETLKPVVGG